MYRIAKCPECGGDVEWEEIEGGAIDEYVWDFLGCNNGCDLTYEQQTQLFNEGDDIPTEDYNYDG